jgi:hypothetical protein
VGRQNLRRRSGYAFVAYPGRPTLDIFFLRDGQMPRYSHLTDHRSWSASRLQYGSVTRWRCSADQRISAAFKTHDPLRNAALLPAEPLISAVTLAELSVGPLIASTEERSAPCARHICNGLSPMLTRYRLTSHHQRGVAFARCGRCTRRSPRPTVTRIPAALPASTAQWPVRMSQPDHPNLGGERAWTEASREGGEFCERGELERLVCACRTGQAVLRRARVMLLAAMGFSNVQIAGLEP